MYDGVDDNKEQCKQPMWCDRCGRLIINHEVHKCYREWIRAQDIKMRGILIAFCPWGKVRQIVLDSIR